MRKKGRIITGIVLTVFLTGILTLALDVQPANAVIDNGQMLVVNEGEEYTLHGPHIYTELVYIAGTLYVTDYDGLDPTKGTLELYCPKIFVRPTGSINADSAGYRKDEGTGAGGNSSGGAGGGGYGGKGGDGGGSSGDGGSTYGTANGTDIDKGSGGGTSHGGGDSWDGGDGGGLLQLDGNWIFIDGIMTSDGSDGVGEAERWCAGGGSGGGIIIEGQLTHIRGTLSAEGGNGGGGSLAWGGGGGGGGRIKIFSSILNTTGSTISVAGGSGGSGEWPGQDGEDGTYYTEGEVESDVTRIPALTEWGMLVLLLLLVAAGIMVLRQRRRATA